MPLVRRFTRVLTTCVLAAVATACPDSSTEPVASTLTANSNVDQTLEAGTAAAAPSVKVKDNAGNGFPGVTVTFAVTAGGGSLSSTTATTNADGVATAGIWVLGPMVGVNTVVATATGLTGSPLTFTAHGIAGAPASLVPISGTGQTAAAGAAVAVAPSVRATDSHGNPIAGATVTFAVTAGGGSVTGGTATTDASGLATVGSWTLGTTAGTNTLSVSIAGLAAATTFTATGTPGAATSLGIQTQPAGAVSGTIFTTQPVIRILDANGNVVAGSTASVTASVASGSGTLSGTTVVTAVNGVATFTNLKITGPGSTTLAFSSSGLATVTSAAFTVADPPAPPAQLAITIQPSATATSGATLAAQPRVEIRDAVGTLANSATNLVTASIASGPGTLTGTTTVAAVNGVATFFNLAIVGEGTSTIAFTSTGLTSATSNAIVVGAPVPANMAVFAGDKQAAMISTALPTAPAVIVTSANGTPVAGVSVTFALALGGGSITGASATTDAAGVARVGSWTLGSTMGLNTLTATATGANSGLNGNPVTFFASGCGGTGAGYKLTLCFTSDMTTAQRNAFTAAAARWEGLITSDVSDVTLTSGLAANACGTGTYSIAPNTVVDDLLIFASVVAIDGPSGILGSAGPCLIRTASVGLTVAGAMRFDVADVANLESAGSLNSVILHEMGHVIGIGTRWSALGLLQNPSTPGGTSLDTYYSGTNGIDGFNTIGGTAYTQGQKVPVANVGGSGSINSHWREGVLQNELMTPNLNSGVSNPLSVLSVKSLADLGYTVNASGADPFFLSLFVTSGGPAAKVFNLENDIYTGPLYTVDSRGRMVRIR